MIIILILANSMLHYHLKLFLVECFANVFYYKNAGKIKKTLKNVKNVTRIKNVKNVFTTMVHTKSETGDNCIHQPKPRSTRLERGDSGL